VHPKFDTGAAENLWRAALWPPAPLLYSIINFTLTFSLSISFLLPISLYLLSTTFLTYFLFLSYLKPPLGVSLILQSPLAFPFPYPCFLLYLIPLLFSLSIYLSLNEIFFFLVFVYFRLIGFFQLFSRIVLFLEQKTFWM